MYLYSQPDIYGSTILRLQTSPSLFCRFRISLLRCGILASSFIIQPTGGATMSQSGTVNLGTAYGVHTGTI